MPAPDGREDRPEMRPDAPEREDFSGQAEGPFRDKRPGMFPEPKMPFLFPGKDAIRFIIALLMLGFNIGIRLLFKSQRDAEALKELESRSLRQQLDYLKYQISPHFFMNTLNNIHALIDIDTEKAKYTVLELSRLMRYLLYESEKGLIDLRKEIEFLSNYLALMRLRYTDQVKITTDLPGEVPDIRIPPLLFISFVENAFKHGISYQETSFVCLSLRVDEERIYFHCINSNRPDQHSPEKGIGLENTQKRLRLLYGNRYHLQMGEHAGTFSISLEIPIKI